MTTLSARDIVSLTIYGEARGEPIEGKVAVANVIGNRLKDGRFGDSLERVCLKPYQFSCWNASDPNRAELMEMHQAIARGEAITDPVYRECEWIADGLIKGVLSPRVGKATHYFAKRMVKPPKWAASGEFVSTVGRHNFYENVA